MSLGERAGHRLRLKLPSGAELEAEGTPEFVAREREQFLARAEAARRPAPGHDPESAALSSADNGPQGPAPRAVAISWPAITETTGRHIHLRARLLGPDREKDACLVLLAASEKVLRLPRPTAGMLARWLRISGYPVVRVDRILQQALERGEALASGSRRGRRYELTAAGRLKAFLIAEQLTGLISGTAKP